MATDKYSFPKVCCSCLAQTDATFVVTETRHTGAAMKYQSIEVPMCSNCVSRTKKLEIMKYIAAFCVSTVAIIIGLVIEKSEDRGPVEIVLVNGLLGFVGGFWVSNWIVRYLRSVSIDSLGNVHFRNQSYVKLFKELNDNKNKSK